MTWTIAASLAALTSILLTVEQRGHPLTLNLGFRGDIKRETAFLAQYGQSVATPLAGWFVAIAHWGGNFATALRWFGLIVLPVLATSVSCMLIKRSLGRIRPNREHAGRFTGFSLKHDAKRESFPSSHSACAMALSVTLAHVWPDAALVFWLLAGICAVLRYVMDAHFPSDVAGGVLLGLAVAQPAMHALEPVLIGKG